MELIEIIAPLVNFAIVVFILWKYGKQPVLDFLGSRSKNIETQMNEAETLFAEAKKQLSEAETNATGAQAQVKRYQNEAACEYFAVSRAGDGSGKTRGGAYPSGIAAGRAERDHESA